MVLFHDNLDAMPHTKSINIQTMYCHEIAKEGLLFYSDYGIRIYYPDVHIPV